MDYQKYINYLKLLWILSHNAQNQYNKYLVGKYLSELLNPLIQNGYSLKDSIEENH